MYLVRIALHRLPSALQRTTCTCTIITTEAERRPPHFLTPMKHTTGPHVSDTIADIITIAL